MPNLVGIGNEQVPTNAMLGGLAYQNPDNTILKNLEPGDIAKIKGKIQSGTNVEENAFVYDTSMDSDGGAWRKRCGHTSWFNESPSKYRGHRKEFPSMAIITVGSSYVNIYDADDPSTPLWMQFVIGNDLWAKHTMSGAMADSVCMLNGILCTGAHSGGRFAYVNFISDDGYVSEGSYTYVHKGIAYRNTESVGMANPVGFNRNLLHSHVMDIDMMVHPGAKINSKTGLPEPSIAIAGHNGVTVIAPDLAHGMQPVNHGTSAAYVHKVCWLKSKPTQDGVMKPRLLLAAPSYWGIIHDPFRQEPNANYVSGLMDSGWYAGGSNWANTPHPTGDFNSDSNNGRYRQDTYEDLIATSVKSNTGRDSQDGLVNGPGLWLQQLSDNLQIDDNSGMGALINSRYNSGWMFGDIRIAALADTKEETITGNIATSLNGVSWTGASSTQGTTAPNGWTGHDGAQFKLESGGDWAGGATYLRLYNAGSGQGGPNSYMKRTMTTVVGKTYTVTWIQKHHATIQLFFNVGSSDGASDLLGWSFTSSSSTPVRHFSSTFTATSTTTYFRIGIISGTNNYSIGVDHVTCTLNEPSRAPRSDQGFTVNGSIIKSAVESGCDLVAYSNFSTSNYLQQIYNDNLDVASNNFCLYGWAKLPPVSSSADYIFDRENSSGQRILMYAETSNSLPRFYVSSSSTAIFATGTSAIDDDKWHFWMGTKSNSVVKLYIDGELWAVNNTQTVGNITDSQTYPNATIGISSGGGNPWGGSLALIRLSLGDPTDAQIKKIYTDEAALFRPNSKCILDGSDSGANSTVTGVAFDQSTGLLHVGNATARNDFMGLQRINSTDEAAGSQGVSKFIRAAGGLIIER